MKLPHLHLSYGAHLNPTRDWGIIVTIALLLLLVSLVWNSLLFNRVARGEVLGSEPTSTKKSFDQNEIDALVKIFTERAVEAAKYQKGIYHFIDPSR